MDAIQWVKRDHRNVEKLLREFQRAAKTTKKAEMERLVREVVKELSIHAACEEQILYPALREVSGTEDEVLEALEEHHAVKLSLAELEKMTAEDERFEAKMWVLAHMVRQHVEEEERALLPRLRRGLSAADLRELGKLLESAKRIAPTHPHPGAPDSPLGSVVAGALAAIVDRTRDALRTTKERGARQLGARARARSAARIAASKQRHGHAEHRPQH